MPTITLLTRDYTDHLFYRDGGGGTVEIHDIKVRSERGVGKGTALLGKLFSRFPSGTKVWAITRRSNGIAQHFYEARGFSILGILKGFYQTEKEEEEGVEESQADAIVYGRTIP